MKAKETDICIVGTGPAGLVLAKQLARSGREILLVESGLIEYDKRVQSLNRGRVHGDPYEDLRITRRRQLGGTINSWNTAINGRVAAKYVPLDAIDFEDRAAAGLPGWPIPYSELIPWYEEAQKICGLGPFAYDAQPWCREPDRPPLEFAAGCGLETRIYQFGLADTFTGALLRELRRASNLTIECGITATKLGSKDAHGHVRSIDFRQSRGGHDSTLHAEVIILATGAIENARLLLVSDIGGDRSGRVGQSFMEHPRDYSMRWKPSDPSIYHDLNFYDQHESKTGVTIMGRLALDEGVLRRHALPQASVTLLPQPRARQGRGRQLVRHLRRRFGLDRLGIDWMPGGGRSERDPPGENFDYVQLLLNLEQAPHRENAVRLPRPNDIARDGPVCLDWRWRREDHERLERTRKVIADAFEQSGYGRIEIDGDASPDPNAHHHAGTTRMSDNPTEGVVDLDGRVHDTENVYCAGASVFPSAGFANPTLTIVALALRLAAHLAPHLPPSSAESQ